MHADLAAAQNLDAEWLAIFEKLGLNIVAVCFRADLQSPIWKQEHVEEGLGLELEAAKAGNYASSFYRGESQWHFFHVHALGNAMKILKCGLESRGLLGIATILHAEESNQLRVWYSPDANAIGSLISG